MVGAVRAARAARAAGEAGGRQVQQGCCPWTSRKIGYWLSLYRKS